MQLTKTAKMREIALSRIPDHLLQKHRAHVSRACDRLAAGASRAKSRGLQTLDSTLELIEREIRRREVHATAIARHPYRRAA